MCGIWSFINLSKKQVEFAKVCQDFFNLKHRGPDNSYFETYNNLMVGFHRLAIMDDTFHANQPFIFEDTLRTIIFVCNGEIYNYKELIEKYKLSESKNDCMVLGEMYAKIARGKIHKSFEEFVSVEVQGEFACTIFEFDSLKNLRKIVVARDQLGIRPLYYHPYKETTECLLFTSELKGGLNFMGELKEFPPGNVFTYTINEFNKVNLHTHEEFTYLEWSPQPHTVLESEYLKDVQQAVMNSVRKRLNADKPIAFLLSGGVDSSLVAAISAKILGKPIRTFCCGMNEGTDLKYARMVAQHIGSNHTEVYFTPQEGIDAIHDVIRTIESWDTTTVRASVGQYIVSKFIGTQTDCRVVMVGEGPDEVCSSYLFNWYAPNGSALHDAARKYVQQIHYYDVKRGDRCVSRWGLEGRVPLLDPEFIQAYWKIPPSMRMPTYKNMEKWWLRQAFQDTNILPDAVLWRKKEAFSDGVSGEKSWYQIIQEWVETLVSDEEMLHVEETFPYCTPRTKEAYYYRKVFCTIFGTHRQDILPGYWQPKWSANGKEVTEYIDPSARVLSVYKTVEN